MHEVISEKTYGKASRIYLIVVSLVAANLVNTGMSIRSFYKEIGRYDQK